MSVVLNVRRELSQLPENLVRIKTVQTVHRLLTCPDSTSVIEAILADIWSGLPMSRLEGHCKFSSFYPE